MPISGNARPSWVAVGFRYFVALDLFPHGVYVNLTLPRNRMLVVCGACPYPYEVGADGSSLV